jgi:hypothetical protein
MLLGGYGENFLPLDSPTTNKLSEKKKKSKNLSRKRTDFNSRPESKLL